MADIAKTTTQQSFKELLDDKGYAICAILFVAAWITLYGPVYIEFMQGLWVRDENTHGPFILAICAGLAYARLSSGEMKVKRSFVELCLGLFILTVGLVSFSWSRIQQVELLLSGSQLIVALGAVISVFGMSGVRSMWFVFVLSLYLIAWPGWAIDMITFPLKLFVSGAVADGLFSLGLPVAHEGAVITIGVYELLVADACAGMNSLIALTSIGVVYLYVVKRPSFWANMICVAMLIPIAILANVIRVTILVCLTYYFGYDAGQSFFHDLSGVVMFGVALLGFFLVDALANLIFSGKNQVQEGSDNGVS